MVDLTPTQIAGLQNKTEDWNPQDRADQCGRKPTSWIAASPATWAFASRSRSPPAVDDPKGARSRTNMRRPLVSHPDPELLQIHDPEKFGCSPCHQGNGRATTSVEKAHGNYEHWLWPLFPRSRMRKPDARPVTPPTWCWSADDVGWSISDGKDLFRQRGCMGCHRYEGYDKEPEELTVRRPADQTTGAAKERQHSSKSAYLMKQADTAASNDEANG